MFRLSKWYLDCVADNGDAAVLYWASLGWGPLHLRYGATLLGLRDVEPAHHYTLRPGPPPARSGDGALHWSSARLAADGTWRGGAPAIERTLLNGRRGHIHWRCVCPGAHATVRIDSHTVTGRGYVECLTMTARPWRLPFNELHWGRFLSPADALIWIAWRGASPATWVFLNGEEQPRAAVTANSVNVPDERVALRIRRGRALRAGRLATTALRPLRAVTLLLPQWRVAHEAKWVSRATLSGRNWLRTGWALHEVVRWP
jgi:hypothetical protein